MISSASALIGSSLHPLQFGFEQLGLCAFGVKRSFLSTGSPHSQQCVSSRMTRALILSRVCPLVLRGLILLPLRSMAMVLTALLFTPGFALGGGYSFGAPGVSVWGGHVFSAPGLCMGVGCVSDRAPPVGRGVGSLCHPRWLSRFQRGRLSWCPVAPALPQPFGLSSVIGQVHPRVVED